VAGDAGADLAVVGIGCAAAGVAHGGLRHALDLLEHGLHSPEAAGSEGGGLKLFFFFLFLIGIHGFLSPRFDSSKSLEYSPYPSFSRSSAGIKRREAELMQ